MDKPRFFEFFAGGGMARAGLGAGWNCTFANDFDPMKGDVYARNWGRDHLVVEDVNRLRTADLPGEADLVWASFPCQDLSLAGNAQGLGTEDAQTRSGAFWAFWRLMLGLRDEGRPPPLIVLENVYGALTSNGGRDFASICRCLSLAGYRFSALLIDGVHFVAQSRPRVFIVAVRQDLQIPDQLLTETANPLWHPLAMSAAIERLAEPDRDQWLWLNLPKPEPRKGSLLDIIEVYPTGVAWHTSDETYRLIQMMSELNLTKLIAMQASGERCVGTVYKRTRRDQLGRKIQRAELRDDNIAGCLRTPGGGSSRQFLIEVEGTNVRSRLLSPREAARLMGLSDTYKLPYRYSDAYHVSGDGVVVPAVRYLASSLLEPILAYNSFEMLRMAAE